MNENTLKLDGKDFDLKAYAKDYPGYPYRFRGTEGYAAGITFVYYSDQTLVTYQTDTPLVYNVHYRDGLGSTYDLTPTQRAMTPQELAEFEAVPEWRAE